MQKPPRSRTKTVLVALGVSLGLLAAAGCWWAFGPRGNGIPVEPETTGLVAPLDAAGYVDYRNALFGPPVPPGENAATPLLTAFGADVRAAAGPEAFDFACGQTGLDPGVAAKGAYVGVAAVVAAEPALGEGPEGNVEDAILPFLDRPWTADESPLVNAWLRANAETLRLVREAASRPAYRLQLPVDALNPAGQLPLGTPKRTAARLLAVSAMRSLADGDPAAAEADVDALFALSRMHNRGPSLLSAQIAQVIRRTALTAERALIRSLPDAGSVAKRFEVIESRPPLTAVADAFRTGERFRNLVTMQEVDRTARGLPPGPGRIAANPFGIIGGRTARLAARRFDAAYASRTINAACEAALAALRSAPAERGGKVNELRGLIPQPQMSVLKQLFDRTAIAQSLMFGTASQFAAVVESRVPLDASEALNRVAAAGRLFELKSGRPPAAAEDLVPEFIDEWPADPMIAAPMRTKTAAGVWTVFFAGPAADSVSFGD